MKQFMHAGVHGYERNPVLVGVLKGDHRKVITLPSRCHTCESAAVVVDHKKTRGGTEPVAHFVWSDAGCECREQEAP